MIAGVVLAAGEASRLGVPKQLLTYRGSPLLAHVVNNLLRSQIDEVVVVIGSKAEQVLDLLKEYPVKVVINSGFATGQSSSLKAGLAALDESTQAVLFALGDQPLVDSYTIDLLIRHYRHRTIVAPYYMGERGNPVLFDRFFFTEIFSLSGDVGAREIILRHPESLVKVDVTDRGVVFDVDTWEDYRALQNYPGTS
ncbi:MAG: nucleotidyltransferase family protein [Desulfotomaculaceae bacterium]|nr:nucleotidyltransferase family protein [Desulfotomaculaceae bacterium]